MLKVIECIFCSILRHIYEIDHRLFQRFSLRLALKRRHSFLCIHFRRIMGVCQQNWLNRFAMSLSMCTSASLRSWSPRNCDSIHDSRSILRTSQQNLVWLLFFCTSPVHRMVNPSSPIHGMSSDRINHLVVKKTVPCLPNTFQLNTCSIVR